MDSGNLAWYIAATALVLFMTPGVALFYGGLVKAKSVISMMMMSFGAMGLVAVLWILYGFNMQTADWWGGILGNPFSDFGLGTMATGEDATVNLTAVAYGATFAIITVALISGAIADRARFGSWMIFAFFFATIDYFAVAGWVWNTNGWIFNLGTTLGFSTEVIDYAGGTAVHINAGAAALALALVLGKRVGFQKGIHKPHNVPLVMLGAAILWFGWFGFNAGAAAFYAAPEGTTGDILSGIAGVGSPAGLIVLNTLGATAAAILGWAIVEKLKDGKPTAVGAASGAVAGLVAITPSCANLAPGWALLLGIIAGAVCALAVELKWRLGFDDSLDVVGVHLVGGLIGTLFLGFFATGTGLFLGGNAEQLILQAIAAVTVLIFSFVVAYVLGFIIEKTIGFRVKNEDEVAGIDTAVHGEEGYALVD
ncbi:MULTISPECIES: ammonium transporter [Microbacterium]|uniref:Ammonium transporter n=1 Tax=Microbacterium hominis TaxID=162426 RepID=A0A134DHR9_9MICO|nr:MULTISPECIES: ammonium transporter [Microbacterium]AUG29849.1 ammonium transporter [Microbacterium hominis]KXC06092.1 ammonia channel protein [Microbacterium hominis]QOC25557.1 ammonium transporter [Microbacterium hominis]QOC29558.1 ammonium transporter [Microbacterium hominis]QYF99250.1 ammonium transporter [Microbacterium sp. PAMC21962]